MKRWALIHGGLVANVVEQEATPAIGGTWVECGNAGPGWSYSAGDFIPPVEVVKRHITVGAFFDRFGSSKWSILADPSPTVQAVIKDASVRDYIDLDNPQLPAGLAAISAAGHSIDETAIITGSVLDSELP